MRKYINIIEYAQHDESSWESSIKHWNALDQKYRNILQNKFTSPDELKNLISAGHPDKAKLEVERQDILELEYGNSEHANLHLIYYFEDANMYCWNAASADMDLLFTRRIIRGMIEICRRLNARRIEIAAVNQGSYPWARMGFVPSAWVWQMDKVHDLRVEIRMMSIPDEIKQHYTDMITDDPKCIWAMADDRKYDHYDDNGRRVQYGKMILNSIHWPGELRFDDKESMNRLNRFVRG